MAFTHGVATNTEAVETTPASCNAFALDADQVLNALETQIEMHPALHDAEQRLVCAMMRGQTALGPFPRELSRSLDSTLFRGIAHALVELHGNVRSDALLNSHVVFGRPAMFAAIVVERLEVHSISIGLHHVVEAEQLETARVGEHGAVVIHELLHATRLFDDIDAGTHVQVIGVRKHNLGVQLVKTARRDALDRSMRTDGHEHGRREVAVRSLVAQRACIARLGFYGAIENTHVK